MMNQDDIILEAFATDLGKAKGNVFRMLSSDWISQSDIVQGYKKKKISGGNRVKKIVLETFYELEVIMILSSLEQQDEVIEGKSEAIKGEELQDNVIYFRRKTVDELAQSFEDYVPPPKSIFDIIKDKIRSFFS